MTMRTSVLILTILINESYGVIYYLNETEYDRMPPIYKLDDYNSCLQNPSDEYCSVNFQLVSEDQNPLLHMIEEYSQHKVSHFNHTELRYGVCVTQNCQYHIRDKVVSEATLEACLNQSLWDGYHLKTRVKHFDCYSLSDKNIKIDAGDIVVGIISMAIVVLNVVGSLYDVFYASEKCEGTEKSILLIFSIKRNWKNLTSTSSTKENLDPRLKRLKSLNGLRTVIMMGVVAAHSPWPYIAAVENPHPIELNYSGFINSILACGSILIQSFFVMSGFLLAYKIELILEKEQINWLLVPKGIFLRYLRLTPAYASVIALTATWFKFLGPGPLWRASGALMVSHCRKQWWLSILYLNNLIYNSQCLLHTWYLAADMQLFCFGLILCVLLKNSNSRKIVLLIFIAMGIIIVAIHTYIRDLDGSMLISPGSIITLFKSDPTFNENYKAAHGNLTSYVIGLSLGYMVYELQRSEIDINKYKKLKYFYWTVLPLIFAVLMSGAAFYRDAPRDPLYIRVLYAAFAKPVIGILIAMHLTGMILKLENVYRKFFEWTFWSITSKLSYSVYIVHFIIIHFYVSIQTSLFQLTVANSITVFVSVVACSFVAATLLFLIIEAPFTKLAKYISSAKMNGEKTIENISQEKIKTYNTRL